MTLASGVDTANQRSTQYWEEEGTGCHATGPVAGERVSPPRPPRLRGRRRPGTPEGRRPPHVECPTHRPGAPTSVVRRQILSDEEPVTGASIPLFFYFLYRRRRNFTKRMIDTKTPVSPPLTPSIPCMSRKGRPCPSHSPPSDYPLGGSQSSDTER